MSTHELYITPPAEPIWQVPATGAARFSWDYDDGRERLLALYQKGKDKQWDGNKRIDWSLEVEPADPLGTPDEALTLYGTPHWAKMTERDRGELRKHYTSWQFSQFLHGEQGAMVCAARIVESVPDLDAKFYSATQTMDEARHAEIYGRFLHEKIGMLYPVNDNLQGLLGDTLRDSRWDMPYLGMQVLIEGLALAAFGMIRDTTTKPLPKQILAYVMQDEARHVAFGRMPADCTRTRRSRQPSNWTATASPPRRRPGWRRSRRRSRKAARRPPEPPRCAGQDASPRCLGAAVRDPFDAPARDAGLRRLGAADRDTLLSTWYRYPPRRNPVREAAVP
ncbi:hypothetical protein SBADM41S_09133 [Streptomyces badius]